MHSSGLNQHDTETGNFINSREKMSSLNFWPEAGGLCLSALYLAFSIFDWHSSLRISTSIASLHRIDFVNVWMFAGIFSCTPSFSTEINKVYLILSYSLSPPTLISVDRFILYGLYSSVPDTYSIQFQINLNSLTFSSSWCNVGFRIPRLFSQRSWIKRSRRHGSSRGFKGSVA